MHMCVRLWPRDTLSPKPRDLAPFGRGKSEGFTTADNGRQKAAYVAKPMMFKTIAVSKWESHDGLI